MSRFKVYVPLIMSVLACSPASEPSAAAASAGTPMEEEVAAAELRGLPVRLSPSDIDSPGYVVRRTECAPTVIDRRNAEARLTLKSQHRRRDEWKRGDTAMTAEYAEGLYSVTPAGLYGLRDGDLLRVNCAPYAATAIVSADE